MVFGFEPNPDVFDKLTNKKLRPFKKRFSLQPYALSDTILDKRKFYINNFDPGTSSLFKPIDERGNDVRCPGQGFGGLKKVIEVNVSTLNHFFKQFPWDRFEYIDYIKIDAQGSDLNILKGCNEYLNKIVYITVEGDGWQYEGADECNDDSICEFLKGNNFIKIDHKNTRDPTYINEKYTHLQDSIYISQY
eukprot:gene19576-23415_t